jgi:translation initiation factor 5A
MLTGIDIFTAGKYECTVQGGGDIDAPNVKRTEYTLLDVNEEGFLSLLSENGDVRDDL